MTPLNRDNHPNVAGPDRRCPLCQATGSREVLCTPRLDGPLLRCPVCRLHFVDSGGAVGRVDDIDDDLGAAMERLALRARQLDLVDVEIEHAEEPWRTTMGEERLTDLLRFIDRGRLLEVGCSTGEFLLAASRQFEVAGVEADRAAATCARARGVDCRNGGLATADFPPAGFDVAVLYHVIEHFHDPRAELRELRRLLKPGGHLVVETPDVANPWFHLLGARWRQIIPDHLFFFSPATIRRLLTEEGFEVTELRHVGKSMSLRLFVSRVGRYSRPLARLLAVMIQVAGLEHRTLRLNLGDVMRVHAIKRGP
jgi:SAM-dependent methyltransferase